MRDKLGVFFRCTGGRKCTAQIKEVLRAYAIHQWINWGRIDWRGSMRYYEKGKKAPRFCGMYWDRRPARRQCGGRRGAASIILPMALWTSSASLACWPAS